MGSTFIWPYQTPALYPPWPWFEGSFDVSRSRDWMDSHWPWSFAIVVIYMILSGVGEQVMKTRKPLDLRGPLALWNICMALFSIAGLIRTTPELIHVLQGENGFHRSVCVRDSHTQAAAFWAWAFTWSKVVELGDTFFIIARKKSPQFIHFYHHSMALVMCWAYYSDYEPIARYFGIINFGVHSILYSYLFLKTIGVPLPHALGKWILSLELAQMVVGLVVNSYALRMINQDIPCARNPRAIRLQMATYASFVLLFAYIIRQREARPPSSKLKNS